MKKTLGLFFFAVTFVIQLNGQTLNRTDIIGKWTVIKLNNFTQLPDKRKQTMEMLRKAFLKSKFEFKADGNFSFDFELEDMKIKDGHWKYNDLTNSYIIQDWKDKDTAKSVLMEIFTKKENNRILFWLAESFFTLEMGKEE
ncbi:MAG TPA: hypothetical protein VGK38_04245 [Prolixibacteraceae bacterium]